MYGGWLSGQEQIFMSRDPCWETTTLNIFCHPLQYIRILFLLLNLTSHAFQTIQCTPEPLKNIFPFALEIRIQDLFNPSLGYWSFPVNMVGRQFVWVLRWTIRDAQHLFFYTPMLQILQGSLRGHLDYPPLLLCGIYLHLQRHLIAKLIYSWMEK